MSSLVIRGTSHPTKNASLCIRNHDLSGTDYEHVARMTPEQAKSVLAGTKHVPGVSRISSHMGNDEDLYGIKPARLLISMRPDVGLEVRNWMMTYEQEGKIPATVGYLRTDTVRQIQAMKGDVDFEEGGPSFDDLENLVDQLRIDDLRNRADTMQAQLDERLNRKEPEPEEDLPTL
jgi:hypothetical protein